MSTKKTPQQKRLQKFKEKNRVLKSRLDYLNSEVLRHEMRQEYERPPFRFNFRETVRRTVETLLIPTLISVIYYCVK